MDTALVPAEIETLKQELTLEIIRSEDFVKAYAMVEDIIATLSKAKDEANAAIKHIMKDEYLRTGNQTIKAPGIAITYVPGGVREAFDSKTFKAENPEVYNKYVKVSATAESLRVKVIKEE